MAVHRWVNKYRVPLPQSGVISEVKPGQQIAKCITEIQEQITEIQEQIDGHVARGHDYSDFAFGYSISGAVVGERGQVWYGTGAIFGS